MLQWIANKLTTNKKTVAGLGVTLAGFFCIWFLFNPTFSSAQSVANQNSSVNQGVDIIQEPLGLPATDIRTIIARVIKTALTLLGVVFIVLILYGGYLWMTAGGNEEKIGQARKVLTNGVIGLIIILSAYAIVLFIFKLLGIDQPGGNGGGGANVPEYQNFQGSGALGSIIKDHYPSRNQVEVPRNTKIAITFRKPISMASIANDTNDNKIFGDCTNIGPAMKWDVNCDQLKLDVISINRADSSTVPISGAAVLGSYVNGKVYTIVIRPYDYLGSDQENVPYLVHISPGVKIDDENNGNPSIFSGRAVGSDFYEWNFTTSILLDTSPPSVNSVFPDAGSEEAKNSVIQIDFSEAMDPTGLQGVFNATGTQEFYYLDGNNIFLKSGNSTIPLGDFILTNGYRTLEFTPSVECGVNACGGKIFCMPVCDKNGANCSTNNAGAKIDSYKLLVRAAHTFSGSSFESIPFSGAMDMSGNALDANKNNLVNSVSSSLQIFSTTADPSASQEQPDNYFWGFNLNDTIDLSAPYLQSVKPGLDSENVAPDELWEMVFSKRMRIDPMYNIGIAQDPLPKNGVSLCTVPRVFFDSGVTRTDMSHCPFISATRTYYMPTLTSDIEDVHFNCFYPGKGPKTKVIKPSKISPSCQADGTNCCNVTSTPQSEAFCCNGSKGLANTAACINSLKQP